MAVQHKVNSRVQKHAIAYTNYLTSSCRGVTAKLPNYLIIDALIVSFKLFLCRENNTIARVGWTYNRVHFKGGDFDRRRRRWEYSAVYILREHWESSYTKMGWGFPLCIPRRIRRSLKIVFSEQNWCASWSFCRIHQ